MTPQTPQTPQPNADDIRRDLQATLAARRDLGPEYDEQFIRSLTDRIAQQIAQARQPAPPLRSNALGPDQRVAVAVCSLIFGIPLVAISATAAGPFGLLLAFAALVLINVAAARL